MRILIRKYELMMLIINEQIFTIGTTLFNTAKNNRVLLPKIYVTIYNILFITINA
jgi:hypothetical protein